MEPSATTRKSDISQGETEQSHTLSTPVQSRFLAEADQTLLLEEDTTDASPQIDFQLRDSGEPTEAHSLSMATEPVESRSSTPTSEQSENAPELQSYQPDKLCPSAEYHFHQSLQVFPQAGHDTSMSTTVGVSEIMPDLVNSPNSMQNDEFLGEVHECEPDGHTSYDGGSSYHDEVPPEDDEEKVETEEEFVLFHAETSKLENNSDHSIEGTTNESEVGIVDESPRPSFQAICEDLDRKNVVSHLQQCHSGQLVMHHPPKTLRQQDIIVLNPQTGEILGSNQSPVQPVHLTSGITKIDILTSHNGNGLNGNSTLPPTNGVNDQPQQYGYRGQSNGSGVDGSHSRSGGGPSGGSNGSTGGGGGSQMVTTGSLERVRQVYSMPQCQTAQVTVFMDRALVCRRVRPRFTASEITEVLFERLSPAIDKDSVRVEIRGAATILDVTYSARSLSDMESTWTHALNELNTELRHCQRQAETLTNRILRITKQRMVLDTFADKLICRDEEKSGSNTTLTCSAVPNHISSGITTNTANSALPPVIPLSGAPSPALSGESKGSLEVINPYDPRNMDTLHRFLGIYEEQAERLDASLLDSNEELEQVTARIEALEKELHDIQLKQDERLARELSVLVEPRETGQVEMLISYVVGRCYWKPAYDIRIFNSDGTMKIVYYGMVAQATGEDWETRSMALSTTLPGTGGTVPNLGLQRVHFKRDHSPAQTNRYAVTNAAAHLPPLVYGTLSTSHRVRSASKMGGFRRQLRPTTTSFHEADRILSDMEQRDGPTPMGTLQRGSSIESAPSVGQRAPASRTPSRRTLGAGVLFHPPTPPSRTRAPGENAHDAVSSTGPTNVPSVYLEVPRPPALIRCDNEPVRVTVGLLDLQPRYEYVTAPKRSLHAYLKATAVNRSDFVILAGETNIYADNTFIGKSELAAVAQGEEFSCNLGAEHGIKVFYRPLFKYREGSSNKYATLTFKQLIEVRNTFDRSIRLMVLDQVPVSGEDKIKVSLLEPVIKHPEKYDRNKAIRMNKSNNVEWDVDLGPGESKELTLKYCIEHPINEDLDVTVVDV